MKNKFTWLDSNAFFVTVLMANIAGLFFTTYYPSMDGPAHLYNSNVLTEMLLGNQFLREFYSFNVIPIPNWLSHFILSLSTVVLPAFLAEKVLLIIYVTGMAVSFRWLITQLAPDNKCFSILIIPFVYTFLFHLGFYNYSLSFIFLFLTLALWFKHYDKGFSYQVKALLLILITLTYFGNVLTYGFLGITLGCFITYDALKLYLETKNQPLSWKRWFNQLVMLTQLALPSLLFFVVFYFATDFFPNDQRIPKDELVKWLIDNRALIVYDYLGDEMYTKKLFWITVFFLLCIAYRRISDFEFLHRVEFTKSDVFLVPLLLALACYFIVADGSGAGMMSLRYCTLIPFLLLLWIVTQRLPSFAKLVVIVVLLLSAGLYYNHLPVLRQLDQSATAMRETAAHIEPGSLVLPVNYSDNWLEIHFSNYLGVDKPMVILENYEASVGWFPIRWNMAKMPRVVLNGKDKVEGLQWVSNNASVKIKPIDYVVIYGNQGKLNANGELKGVLETGFTKVYHNDFVTLYKRK